MVQRADWVNTTKGAVANVSAPLTLEVGYSTSRVSGSGGTAVDQTFAIGLESVASDVQLAIMYFDV